MSGPGSFNLDFILCFDANFFKSAIINIHRYGKYKILTQTQEFYNCWFKDIIDEEWNVSLSPCYYKLDTFTLKPSGIYLLIFNNRNARTRCEICSSQQKRHQSDADVFIVNFEYISHLVLVFLLLSLNMLLTPGKKPPDKSSW